MLICDFCVNVVMEFKQKQENETPNCMLLEDMCQQRVVSRYRIVKLHIYLITLRTIVIYNEFLYFPEYFLTNICHYTVNQHGF